MRVESSVTMVGKINKDNYEREPVSGSGMSLGYGKRIIRCN